MNEKQQRVLEILSEVAKRPVAGLKPEHRLKDDLELDSTQGMELLATMEEEFDIEIDELEAARLQSVADLLAKVEG